MSIWRFPRQSPGTTCRRTPGIGFELRVHVLPYLPQSELYNQFNLNEPWDSPHNKGLIARMPAVYRRVDAKLTAQGKTRIVAPVGDKLITTKKAERGKNHRCHRRHLQHHHARGSR